MPEKLSLDLGGVVGECPTEKQEMLVPISIRKYLYRVWVLWYHDRKECNVFLIDNNSVIGGWTMYVNQIQLATSIYYTRYVI